MEEGAEGFEREILAAGIADGPSAPSVRKAAAALGIAGTVVGAAGTVSTVAAAGLPLALKLVGIATLVVGTAVAGVGLYSHAEHGVRVRRQRLPQPTTEPAAPLPAAASATEIAVVAPTPPEPTPSMRPLPRSLSRPAAPARALGLAAETGALDEARSALRSGQPAQALRALDSYSKSFPRGAMAQEATVLRIEALSQLGDRSGADALAARVLRAHPTSPLAPRVRALAPSVSNP